MKKSSEYRLPPQALIVGCGDIGLRLARQLRALGREVTGVVRSGQSAAALRVAGVRPLIADLDLPGATIPNSALVFYFAAPPLQGRSDPRLRRFLAGLRVAPQKLVYISTSGVYGDCAGRWIDEDAPLQPQSERAWRRLDAEQALAEFAVRTGTAVMTLRVPGIYGPGRLPLERLRQGLPVVRESESPYTNRIHAEDLATAALLAAQSGEPGRAYNISDGTPTSMCDYFCRCARLLGLPEPAQVSMEQARLCFTPAMLLFLEESKRLVTARLRDELGFTPRYPDLAAGLPSCLSSD